MYAPVLVSPAASLPITVLEVARLLRKVVVVGEGESAQYEVEDQDDIEFQIKAALEHYQGWNGILGISLAKQTWRQDFDRFSRSVSLPLGPVVSIGSVTWRNPAGQVSTVPTSAYALMVDAGGVTWLNFDREYVLPTDLYEHSGVSVAYDAGFESLPFDIRAAIALRVQLHLDEAASANAENLRRVESDLVGKYRRMSI
jgi:uncharacterized phiE125 gp8 family phage protein